jgi:hypothetical protein
VLTYPVEWNGIGGSVMLRVTVEIVPFGNELLTREIGKMIIANDCSSGNAELGNYIVIKGDMVTEINVIGKIKKHVRSEGCWPLVAKAAQVYQKHLKSVE